MRILPFDKPALARDGAALAVHPNQEISVHVLFSVRKMFSFGVNPPQSKEAAHEAASRNPISFGTRGA
jgi:hypothetical protein